MAEEIQEFVARLNREDVVSFADFQKICARLCSETIILAEDSQLEADLYDKALLVRSDLTAVLAMLGLSLVHSERLRYFRVYPPAATSPGATDRGDLHRSEASLYRRPLGPGVGVLLFVLRLIYVQGLLEGKVVREKFVATDLAEIHITLKNKTGRDPLPAHQRQSAFRELASLWRVIRYDAKEKLDEPTTVVLIHPIICDLISNDRAQGALDALRQERKDAAPDGGAGDVEQGDAVETTVMKRG
jgi:Domain of unknown function (DUF4194)